MLPLQAERARRIEEKGQLGKYERQMQGRQEYVARCQEELEDRRRKVGASGSSFTDFCQAQVLQGAPADTAMGLVMVMDVVVTARRCQYCMPLIFAVSCARPVSHGSGALEKGPCPCFAPCPKPCACRLEKTRSGLKNVVFT